VLRMRPAPALAGPAPVFVPTSALQAAAAAAPGGSGAAAAPPRPRAGARAGAAGPRGSSDRPPRLQHDDPYEMGLEALAVL